MIIIYLFFISVLCKRWAKKKKTTKDQTLLLSNMVIPKIMRFRLIQFFLQATFLRLWQRAVNESNTNAQFDAAKSSQARLDACRQRGAAAVYMPPLLSLFMPVWVLLHLCATLSYIQPLISGLCQRLSDSLHFCKGTLLAQHAGPLLARILRKPCVAHFLPAPPRETASASSRFFVGVGLLFFVFYFQIKSNLLYYNLGVLDSLHKCPIENSFEIFCHCQISHAD